MRPKLDRENKISISIATPKKPNKRDCYTRNSFFGSRFTYIVESGRIIFRKAEDVVKGKTRIFAIDKAGAFKGDIAAEIIPAGVYDLKPGKSKNELILNFTP